MKPLWHFTLAGLATLALAWVFFGSSRASAHGSPIYVSVNSDTNQVEVSGSFDDAVIGAGLDSDAPGIGVVSTASGIDPGQIIRLRISQELLYSDSQSLTSTTAKVTLYSAEFAQFYEVTQQTGVQEYLDWATYPENAGIFWDLDGLFELDPGNTGPGVYGVAAQVIIDGAIDSEPFLISLVYNPSDLEGSKEVLRQSVLQPEPADFTRNWRVDEEDLAAWEANFGLSASANPKVFGDADEDLDIDGADFLQWQREYDFVFSLSDSLAAPVPEPASSVLLCFAFLLAQRLRI